MGAYIDGFLVYRYTKSGGHTTGNVAHDGDAATAGISIQDRHELLLKLR